MQEPSKLVLTRRELIQVSLGAGLACRSAVLAAPKAPPVTPTSSFVRTAGKDIVGPNGEKLLLRGINLGNWLEQEGYMFLFEHGPQSPHEIEIFFDELIGPDAATAFWEKYRQQYITRSDVELIRDCGFNSVRLPIHYKFFLADNALGFAIVDRLLEWCRAASIWVILDLHCAPGGQTGTNIDDSVGYPWLYESEEAQERTIDVWKRIAKHYREEPTVLGYDLLNEPIPHFPRLRQYNAKLEPLYKRITAAIREVDSNHIILLGGAQWDSNFEVFGPPFDSQLIYQFHKYWTATSKDVIQKYLNYRDRYNVPIWLGESGENNDEWIAQFVRTLNQNNVGWCFWPYKKMGKASCVASIQKPEGWDEVVALAKMPGGTGAAEKLIAARPTVERSRVIVESLLDAVSVKNCRINAGYLQALGLQDAHTPRPKRKGLRTTVNNRRREFLKASFGAAALTQFRPLRGQDQGTLKAWLTSGEQRFARTQVPQWRTAAGPAKPAVHLDASGPRQEILGFGAAFTDSSCYLFSQLPGETRKQLMKELFGKSGLNLSVCRTCVGSSDYSRNVYSYDDSPSPDPTLSHFSIEHDRAYILPALREARQVNPDLFLFSTPWSPPGWMKAGNSMLGGSMRKEYFDPYAQYFMKFLQAYRQEGLKIDAITVQNELDADQNSRMPACIWGQEYEVEFVKWHLGPAFQKAGIDSRIWIIDHNYNLWGRAIDELEDRDMWKFVEGVAWHGYAGQPTSMSRVHEAFPDKSMYWTEGGPAYTDPDYLTSWAKWAETYIGILRNWARCIVGWNLALDEHGKPNIGPFDCGGMVTIHSGTQAITRSGQYWAFAHFSKLVRRGAHAIASEGEVEGVSHVAFRNPDGSHVAVLANTGQKQTVPLRFGEQTTEAILPANSVLTLAW